MEKTYLTIDSENDIKQAIEKYGDAEIAIIDINDRMKLSELLKVYSGLNIMITII